MARLTPKQIYEKIVINGQQATPEELKQLEGTHWQHKLNGTTPDISSVYKSKPFKTFYEEEDTIASAPLTRSSLALKLIDKIEDKFDLHFAVIGANRVDESKLNDIKKYIASILEKANINIDDRRSIIRAVNKSASVSNLVTRLHLFTA